MPLTILFHFSFHISFHLKQSSELTDSLPLLQRNQAPLQLTIVNYLQLTLLFSTFPSTNLAYFLSYKYVENLLLKIWYKQATKHLLVPMYSVLQPRLF